MRLEVNFVSLIVTGELAPEELAKLSGQEVKALVCGACGAKGALSDTPGPPAAAAHAAGVPQNGTVKAEPGSSAVPPPLGQTAVEGASHQAEAPDKNGAAPNMRPAPPQQPEADQPADMEVDEKPAHLDAQPSVQQPPDGPAAATKAAPEPEVLTAAAEPSQDPQSAGTEPQHGALKQLPSLILWQQQALAQSALQEEGGGSAPEQLDSQRHSGAQEQPEAQPSAGSAEPAAQAEPQTPVGTPVAANAAQPLLSQSAPPRSETKPEFGAGQPPGQRFSTQAGVLFGAGEQAGQAGDAQAARLGSPSAGGPVDDAQPSAMEFWKR